MTATLSRKLFQVANLLHKFSPPSWNQQLVVEWNELIGRSLLKPAVREAAEERAPANTTMAFSPTSRFLHRAKAHVPRLLKSFIRRSGTLVKTEASGNVVVIKINRPDKRNAVNVATAGELAEAFRKFEVDDKASVAVLCGEGGTFCGGYDLEELSEADPEEFRKRVPPVGEGDAPMVRGGEGKIFRYFFVKGRERGGGGGGGVANVGEKC